MNKRLNSDTIKIIAMVLMLIDHIGVGIVEKIYYSVSDYNLALKFNHLDTILRSFGRIAYPLFAYMLVKGFFYTKNRVRHLANILVFALISEIPFDLVDEGIMFNFRYQNVMITLALGTVMIWALEVVRQDGIQNSISNLWLRKAAYSAFAIVLIACVASFNYLLHADYGARGIVTIAIIYMLKDDNLKLVQLGPILFLLNIFLVTLITEGNIHSTVKYFEFEVYAIAAFPIMYADTGIRNERRGYFMKWLGYWFYPVHMLVIYLIGAAVVK